MTTAKYSSASRLSAKDAFKAYKKKNPGTTVTYSWYKHVITEFNKKATERILEGEMLNMGFRLGSIWVVRIDRNFDKPVIDWPSTMELKKQGISQWVYYTDDYYYRWAWTKSKCVVKNKSVYAFQASRGPNGNCRRLARKLKSDEFAYLNYKQFET